MKKLRFTIIAVILAVILTSCGNAGVINNEQTASDLTDGINSENGSTRFDDTSAALDTETSEVTEQTDFETETETEPEPSENAKTAVIDGNYYFELTDSEYGAAGVRLETLSKGERLLFSFYTVYDGFELGGYVYDTVIIMDGGAYTAKARDGETVVELSAVAGGVEVLCMNGEAKSEISGTYLPVSKNDEYIEPPFPEPVYDVSFSGGKIEAPLAIAARSELGMNENDVLTPSDCERVERLNIFNDRPVDLCGIEYFKNLKEITISQGYLRDISALKELKYLESISISWCYITEIPDFSECERLECLGISTCNISDLGPVTYIKNLKTLNLSFNSITSVAPIKDMTSIERLYLDGNCITDWDSIKNADNLRGALEWDYDLALRTIEKAKAIVEETVDDGMSDLEKQVRLCKKIAERADYTVVSRGAEPYGYEVIVNGRGVCLDFAEAVALTMRLAGLEVITCSSDTHAWNMINIDGSWYEFDCMWDDGTDPLYWNYFDLSRDDMSKISQHGTDPYRYPYAARSMRKVDVYDYIINV